MTDPYVFTDPQNHRLVLHVTTDAFSNPYVWLAAENLAQGGAQVNVWLPVDQARDLATALDAETGYQFTDHTGDTLTVEPGEAWTAFVFDRCAGDDLGRTQVRVIVLTARLPELRAALTVAAEQAEAKAADERTALRVVRRDKQIASRMPRVARFDSVLQPTGDDPRTAIVGTLDDGHPIAILLDPEKVPGVVDELHNAAWTDRQSSMVCVVCETPVGWIDSPTGGWWAHATHPDDDHDAQPRPADAGQAEQPFTEARAAFMRDGAKKLGKANFAQPKTDGLTVYRAQHDSIVMGLYTTVAAARQHCEAAERGAWPAGTHLTFDWIEDEEEDLAEMTVFAGQNEESITGYVVEVLTAQAAYDEEADE